MRSGPCVSEAVFLNHEEVALRPVYRDPVHDFGFFRFDPGDLRFMKPEALRLAPEHALYRHNLATLLRVPWKSFREVRE